ncbi:tyrosine-type recombinase/integrase [Desulfobacterales bacterium HSG17]|nr:tyrosine-type recombinase/integrase [Desulfobacterales bacterium HSG17]
MYENENPNTFFDRRPSDLKKRLDSSAFDNILLSKNKSEISGHHFSAISPKSNSSSTSRNNARFQIEASLKRIAEKHLPGQNQVAAYLFEKYRKNLKLNTIRNNAQTLELFLGFYKSNGKSSLKQIARDDIAGFVEFQQDQDLKIVTVNSRLITVYSFVRFLVENGIAAHNLLDRKLRLKLPDALPRAMDPYDVDQLLKFKGKIRDRAMIMILLRTGMRIGELLDTKVSDVNMKEQKILIYIGEKNRLGRVVCFSQDAKKDLLAWMSQRDPGIEILFYGQRGRKLSYSGARKVFMRYFESAGLAYKGYTLHCLRHTFATELLNAGMRLECLQQLMGHSCIEMTRRYARLTDKTRENEYFKAMTIIERPKNEDHYKLDSELQALFEEKKLFPSHSQKLPEHP